jgi:hypothetical protein
VGTRALELVLQLLGGEVAIPEDLPEGISQTDGEPRRYFTLTAFSAEQQQAGGIGAGNQQEATDSCLKQEQYEPGIPQSLGPRSRKKSGSIRAVWISCGLPDSVSVASARRYAAKLATELAWRFHSS